MLRYLKNKDGYRGNPRNCSSSREYESRKGSFLIVGMSVVGDEEDYETVAIVINEAREIEAFNIEGFAVDQGITNIIGCYLEYWEDENGQYDGRIIACSRK